MSSSTEKIIETDVLVIGGGEAGCFASVKAKEQGVDVILVDKGYVGKAGQTPCANFTSVFLPDQHNLDDWMKHINQNGEYMNDREWTEIILKESLARWQDICSWGLQVFKWDKSGGVVVSSPLEDDGEIVSRSWSGRFNFKTYTPRYPIRQNAEIMRKQVKKTGVKIMDRIMITDLIKQDGRIVGAIGISADNYDSYVFKAKATILCMGASGLKAEGIRTYATTGDGLAMAYRAGCAITGKEWTEHHPVRADFPTWPWSALDRDRLKSEGGKHIPMATINAEEQDVGAHWHPSNSNFVEVFEAHAGRAPTFWECAGNKEFVMPRSPKGLPRKDIDEEAQKLYRVRVVQGRSVGQSVHVGEGVWPINKKCETQVPGLYAAGDCLGARAGGAVYPGQGFSTTFCAVTGTRAGIGAAEFALQSEKAEVDKEKLSQLINIMYEPMERKGGFTPTWVTQVLQSTLFPYWILYMKHGDRLQSALTQIEFIKEHIIPKLTAKDHHELRLAHEVKSMVLNAEMKLRASLFRTESRASHIREDFPRRDDPSWLAWVKIEKENDGMKLIKEPIPKEWWPDMSLPYEERYPIPFPAEGRK